MTQHRPGQRRGLGRGLGSLIPTAPPAAPAPGSTTTATIDPYGPEAGAASPSEEAAASAAADGGAGSEGASTTDGQPSGGGLSAEPERIVPEGLAPVDGAYFAEVDVTAITPNPRQPRQVFDEEALAELVHSVKEVGLLQPVVVRRTGEDRYELIMGERRWRATQEAGLEKIPAIVRETSDDAMLRDALLENLHRSQLNPLEEAAAYQQLLDDFGCTHEELAHRIGRSRPQISNTLRLLKLSPAVQRRVAAGVLSAGHARALLAVENADTQDRLAARVISEGISVRGLEEIVAVGDLGSENKPRPRPRKPHAPALDDLAGRLSDRLETRVKVALGKTKGRITVEFASIPDLERIVDLLDPKNDRPI
jgi:ParB family transcriptional regulator, chromosome partitioning protein